MTCRVARWAGNEARTLDPSGLDFITGSYRSLRRFAARFLEQLPMYPYAEVLLRRRRGDERLHR